MILPFKHLAAEQQTVVMVVFVCRKCRVLVARRLLCSLCIGCGMSQLPQDVPPCTQRWSSHTTQPASIQTPAQPDPAHPSQLVTSSLASAHLLFASPSLTPTHHRCTRRRLRVSAALSFTSHTSRRSPSATPFSLTSQLQVRTYSYRRSSSSTAG